MSIANTLVLSCIDFRIVDTVRDFMDARGYNNKYNITTLPGASLGFNHICNWRNTFLDIIDISIRIQNISQIVIVDHMDCRYYQSVYSPESKDTHIHNFQEFKKYINSIYPNLSLIFILINHDNLEEFR